jgi:uncharacterized phage protein (predicted DNA packaging)
MAYATPALLKQYLGVDGSGDDVLLTSLIARAQSAIDHYTGRTFEASADTTRKFTVGVDTDGRMLYFDEDCAAITTVKTNADDGSGGTTIASTEYVTHPRNRTPYHAIDLLSSSSNSWTYTTDPEAGITVAGKWAYSTTAPDDIVHACIRLAGYYYRQKDAGVFDTTAIPDMGVIQVPQGIPRDVQLILNPYRKAV